LRLQNGKATPEALETTLKKGRVQKRTYYHSRLAPLNNSGAKVLATLLRQAPASSGLNMMRTPLLKKLVKKGPMSQEAAEHFFDAALHRDVLSNAGTKTPFHYDIPIPSMKTFLLEIFELESKSKGR